MKEENSIDVPLSVLEAAACNIPILATPYGELKEFYGKKGIVFLDNISSENVEVELNKVLKISEVDNRSMIREYDWVYSSAVLESWI